MRKILLLAIFMALTIPAHAFGTNGCDNNATILLHMNDSGFTESDCNGNGVKTVTNTGAVIQDSVLWKFPSSSAKFDGTSRYLNIANDSDLNWTGVFTVDEWVRTTDKTADVQFRVIWDNGNLTSTVATLELAENASGFMDVIDGTAGGTEQIIGTTDISTGAWFHVAVIRDSSNNVKLYVNGTQEGGTWNTATNFGAVGAQPFAIGIYSATNITGRWNGNIDELRISNGTARWTANFSAPPSQYCSGCEMMGVLE